MKRCNDCGKSLLFRNAWYHPLEEGKFLCDDCTHKYDRLRDKQYLNTLEKVLMT